MTTEVDLQLLQHGGDLFSDAYNARTPGSAQIDRPLQELCRAMRRRVQAGQEPPKVLKPEQRQHIENLLRHQGIRLPPLAYCNEWYLLEMYAAAVFEGERRQHPVVSGDRLHLTANAHKLAMFGSESSQHMMKDAKERGILKPYVSPKHNLVCLLPSNANSVACLSGRYPREMSWRQVEYWYHVAAEAAIPEEIARWANSVLTNPDDPDKWLTLSHLCHHAGCCNPAHIVLEILAANLARKACAARGECVGGCSPPCFVALQD